MPSHNNFSRRNFIKTAGIFSVSPSIIAAKKAAATSDKKLMNHADEDLYLSLLRQWCDGMERLQIKDIKSPGVYGGIMCPAGSRIRGRTGDAVYPFMCMAKITGNEKYLDAAVRLQAWSGHASRYDGSWVNEVIGAPWKGITVFSTIALGEALHHHGNLLDAKVLQQWTERLQKAADFVYRSIDYNTPAPINYPLSASAALAVAGKVLGEARYQQKAKELAHKAVDYFTEPNKLIFGEGPRNKINGGIDLGYNVEESLPNLVLYTRVTGDTTLVPMLVSSLEKHLEFMLPDGGWDNSWGTRNFKWTYWGSRTTDGCQPAYALMSNHNPLFAAAALQNLKLLQACTHDGLLYGGPHYQLHGELPDVHHTFCHAKAIASCVDYGVTAASNNLTLPREKFNGIKPYPEIATWLIGKGKWKATVTNYGVYYNADARHVSGGALSLLWHAALGPVLSASMARYHLQESDNMQPVKDEHYMELTPRIEVVRNNKIFSNLHDINANVTYTEDKAGIKVTSKGVLCNEQLKYTEDKLPFEITYLFTDKFIDITVDIAGATEDNCNFYLPVISKNTEQVQELSGNSITFYKAGGKLTVSGNRMPVLWKGKTRVFNHVPGLEALPLVFNFAKEKGTLKIRLSVVS